MRLTDEEVARFAAQRYRFPGVEIKARLFRTYPLGETGAHVIGYIGRINQKEKERIEDSDDAANYRGTDYIGKLGVEQLRALLHGTTGVQRWKPRPAAAPCAPGQPPATPGKSMQLSIDIKLQKMVEDLYGSRRGALVAIDPRNGEVLALVSKPTFDPNLFVDGIDQESWDELNGSLTSPCSTARCAAPTRRAPPTSPSWAWPRWKPASARPPPSSWTAAPGPSAATPSARATRWGRWTCTAPSPVQQRVLLPLANDMGVDAIHDFMKPLGFGQITGIDLPGEVRGVLPSTDWKRATYKRPSSRSGTRARPSLGIGQGYNNFTMLQLASATATWPAAACARAAPAQGRQDPHRPVPARRRAAGQSMGYQADHLATILRAMVAVTQEAPRAPCSPARLPSGGKTGTAQAVTIGQNSQYNAARLAEYQRDHSLYIAFAPADTPPSPWPPSSRTPASAPPPPPPSCAA
jgi:penicillin-binding protein 2